MDSASTGGALMDGIGNSSVRSAATRCVTPGPSSPLSAADGA